MTDEERFTLVTIRDASHVETACECISRTYPAWTQCRAGGGVTSALRSRRMRCESSDADEARSPRRVLMFST